MINSMKNDFINAYTWMYGSTKKQAEAAYRRAMESQTMGISKRLLLVLRVTQRKLHMPINRQMEGE